MSAAALRDRFAGRWALKRDIFNVDAEWLGHLDGHATFRPVDTGLHYLEEGTLEFAGLSATRATRAYRWHFPGAGQIDVRFDDDRPFHTFTYCDGRAHARHFCDPDDYAVTYDFSRWPTWRSEWRVEGPRKDYRMVSIFTRC